MLKRLDLASGAVRKVASEPILSGAQRRSLRAAWSPDSQWIAYALGNLSAYRTVYVYSLAKDESRAVTDGMSDATEPAFDASGEYLYFLASTDAGPLNQEPKAGTGGGLLGADYEIANGRYRFRKIYEGAAWWPDLRAPLAAPRRGREGRGVPARRARRGPEAACRRLRAVPEHR